MKLLEIPFFGIISIRGAAYALAIGGFYNLICAKLAVPPLQNPVNPANLPAVTEKEKVFLYLQK
jgi:hypothetical protein